MGERLRNSTTDLMPPELLAALLDRHAAALQLYAAQWTGDAGDVVQEAFVRLAQQADAPDNVAAWLYRVVRNAAISAGRSARRRRQREQSVALEGEAWFVESPGNRLDARAATAALKSLPAEQREVVVARLWGGLTFDEIAAAADIASSTAHRRYEAALASLRERLQEQWTGNSPTMSIAN